MNSISISLLAASVGIIAALTARTRPARVVLWAGSIIMATVWLPLFYSVQTGWGGDNPIGLGLLAVFGTYLGFFVLGMGLILRLLEFVPRR